MDAERKSAIAKGADRIRCQRRAKQRTKKSTENEKRYRGPDPLFSRLFFDSGRASSLEIRQVEFGERTGLRSEDANRRASEYSKGMHQKVGIAIALAKNASAILMDEPTSGLDPQASNGENKGDAAH